MQCHIFPDLIKKLKIHRCQFLKANNHSHTMTERQTCT